MDDCFLHIFLCTLYKIMSAPVKIMILMSAKNGIQEDKKIMDHLGIVIYITQTVQPEK